MNNQNTNPIVWNRIPEFDQNVLILRAPHMAVIETEYYANYNGRYFCQDTETSKYHIVVVKRNGFIEVHDSD